MLFWKLFNYNSLEAFKVGVNIFNRIKSKIAVNVDVYFKNLRIYFAGLNSPLCDSWFLTKKWWDSTNNHHRIKENKTYGSIRRCGRRELIKRIFFLLLLKNRLSYISVENIKFLRNLYRHRFFFFCWMNKNI